MSGRFRYRTLGGVRASIVFVLLSVVVLIPVFHHDLNPRERALRIVAGAVLLLLAVAPNPLPRRSREDEP